jgi:hypothetical protein
MSGFLPDCLVFKIEEIEADTGKIDNTIYIIYDKKNHKYLIRGQRKCTPNHQSCTYSFECDFVNELADFIQYVICPHNKVNEILYNYDNFPKDPNKISFEFLNENDHGDYEISGYNNKKLKKVRLLRNLSMLRSIYNFY